MTTPRASAPIASQAGAQLGLSRLDYVADLSADGRYPGNLCAHRRATGHGLAGNVSCGHFISAAAVRGQDRELAEDLALKLPDNRSGAHVRDRFWSAIGHGFTNHPRCVRAPGT
jgi:hypothetical protein